MSEPRRRIGGEDLPDFDSDELRKMVANPAWYEGDADPIDDHREWETGHDFIDEFGAVDAFGEVIE